MGLERQQVTNGHGSITIELAVGDACACRALPFQDLDILEDCVR
jgi:hypothetical protein